jgi:hypothetical protein
MADVRVGSIVKVIRGAGVVAAAYRSPMVNGSCSYKDEHPEDIIYEVLVIVVVGWDYRGNIPTTGYILKRLDSGDCSYPYVWDYDRFEQTKG